MCGISLTKNICEDILKDSEHRKRFVHFLNFLKQHDISQKAVNYAFQFACLCDLLQFFQDRDFRFKKGVQTDPSADGNYAIRLAARNGHTEIVKYLLTDPRVDPSANGNYAIQWASSKGHADVVKLLLADSRVDSTFTMGLVG
ncbi:hypothetical protein O9G_003161 [Rozella allomycis CSF55]|uniref:Uncharacterized protein n=1 Tax=Rozella allomycis (strain CSF55) TaxID=988480 RepID=A0A075AUZ4_ROZAC|nr:hypothetical protein O9G_003161 [Rozella allomycis CSF55]|eukprot:EPZ34081.1 hypothetical protein O9G_003161 [Rozella allomycis CSF55]